MAKEIDELYQEVRRVVIETKAASVSMLQRRFRIGYSRAARIIDQLEENGVIGPYEGSKPREVLIKFSDETVKEKPKKEKKPKEDVKKTKPLPKLNAKQTLFAQEYMVDLNATAAAKRAGYSEKTAGAIGNENLQKPQIRAYIEELQAERAEKVELNAEWVLNRLKEISDKCMQAEPVVEWDNVERAMIETGEYEFDSTGANRATELIGKHLGMFKDKVDITGDLSIKLEVDYGDDEQ